MANDRDPGANKAVHLSANVRTLVFEKVPSETREPESVLFAELDGTDMQVTIEWFRAAESDTIFLSMAKTVAANDSQVADLNNVLFRENDQLYLTTTSDSDVVVYLSEPRSRRT